VNNNKLPISVVIPTMNRPATLKRTLDYLISKEYIPSEIIVVDQSESEEKQNLNRLLIETCNTEIRAIYIYQKEPSLTKARNQGFTLCKNDIIVFSDDDVDVNDNTILNINEVMRNSNIAMIAGIDTNMGNSRTHLSYIFGKKSLKYKNIGHVTLSMLGRYPDNIRGEVDTQWAMGYFFVIRKSLADKWHMKWDENLKSYAYAEDLDFSYTYYKKAQSENLRCILCDKVKVAHLTSQEWRVQSYKSTAMYVLNREYLSYKHFETPLSRLATRWSNFGEFIIRILKRSNPLDLLYAQIICDKYRKEIKQQKLFIKLYER